MLNNPAFTRYKVEYGEISSYPAGYKENAGIFCHNNPWIIIGETLAGRGDDAWDHYRKICPTYIKDQTLHKVEPYVYSQMVAGKDAARPGEGKNSWLTGTLDRSLHPFDLERLYGPEEVPRRGVSHPRLQSPRALQGASDGRPVRARISRN